IVVLTVLLYFFLKFWLIFRKWRQKIVGDEKPPITVAFFHPYCNAGGGGERVLWLAIRALQKKYGSVIKCYVYTGDTDATPDEILTKAEGRFGLARISGVEFIYLKRRSLVEARLYPYFTLLGQSLGEWKFVNGLSPAYFSPNHAFFPLAPPTLLQTTPLLHLGGLLLGLEAIFNFVPDVFIDSMGYSFVTPLFYYLANCRTASYVHYPTISTEMLSLVEKRRENFNNRRFISDNAVLSYCKLIYYRFFAKMYGLSGKSNMVVMSKIRLISVGQFRPEKNHLQQLETLHLLIKNPHFTTKSIKLILIGGCRNDDDARRVDWLKKEAENLGVADFVQFKLNVDFDVLKEEFSRALIGLHSMKNEHFGIAAGLITIAHKSGGPLADIIDDGRDGFLAENAAEYVEKIIQILKMKPLERDSIRKMAKISCRRFSDENFQRKFCLATEKLFL
uniref:GDP-Man:Man(3)GlcNAc(2)-PP-Dol alpha-1,2-mannosyltransferase n=1 Tax=Romanomermis culicivorax TaxID=13658 RepID=A0A915L3M5_ROMCU